MCRWRDKRESTWTQNSRSLRPVASVILYKGYLEAKHSQRNFDIGWSDGGPHNELPAYEKKQLEFAPTVTIPRIVTICTINRSSHKRLTVIVHPLPIFFCPDLDV